MRTSICNAALPLAIALLSLCGEELAAKQSRDGMPPPAAPFPMADCPDLTPVAGRVARDLTFIFDNDPTQQGVVGITDLSIGPDSTVLLLDGRGHQVVVLDSRGRETARWGREGPGPGEFRDPIGIESEGSLVYVLDASGLLHIFQMDGSFVRAVRLNFQAYSFGALGQGRFALTSSIRTSQQSQPHVAVADTTGQVDIVTAVPSTQLGQRPFIAPISNPAHVSPGAAGRFVVWYELDNSVDIYQNGTQIASVRGCMPEGVLRSYQEQRRVYAGRVRGTAGPGFASRRVIGGAWLDATGDLLVANFRTAADMGRISRYDSLGRPKAVYDFPIDGYDFQNAKWIDGHGIMTWHRSLGWVRRWIVEDLP